MPKTNLTAKFCEGIKADKWTDYQDEKAQGLSLRVSPTGGKTWTFRYVDNRDGSKMRLRLGKFPALPLVQARQKAFQLIASIASGEGPERRTRSEVATVRQLGRMFIENYSKPNKKTWREDQRVLNAYVYPIIGNLKLETIKRRDILDVLDSKSDKQRQSALMLAVLRKMFNWAVDEDYLNANPAIGVKPRGKSQSRERVLQPDELREIWASLPPAPMSNQMRNIIQLLLLTAQRSGEVSGMMAKEVDLSQALWTIPRERTKNGQTHTVPLSDSAMAIIREAMPPEAEGLNVPVFTTVGTAIESNAVAKAVRKHLQFFEDKWTPHDLRRTAATGMAGIGIQPHVIEAVLNHVSGFRSGVAGIYNRHSYDAEKRQALDMWAEHVEALVGEKPSKVIPIRA